jgi:hypothetical protein
LPIGVIYALYDSSIRFADSQWFAVANGFKVGGLNFAL